MGIQPFLPSQQ
uniref:Uncharacterized protein n=1 Tax=Oryza glumipatula TaxID=40148 RepID=A0A0D9YRL9_9ORYZ